MIKFDSWSLNNILKHQQQQPS